MMNSSWLSYPPISPNPPRCWEDDDELEWDFEFAGLYPTDDPQESELK